MSEYVLRLNGREYRASVKELTPDRATIGVDGVDYHVDLVQLGRRPASPAGVRAAETAPLSALPAATTTAPRRQVTHGGEGVVSAPMPGMVLSLKVREGEKVQAGQVLLVMEAMKMENAIAAPFAGTIVRVHVHEGDAIAEGDRLIELDRPKLTAL
jgi:biotin carboxyl carrier protein